MSARAQGNSLVQSLLWEELFHLTGHLLDWGRRVWHGMGWLGEGPRPGLSPNFLALGLGK